MCLGIPLQVRSVPSWGVALCGSGDNDAGHQPVETSLLHQPPEPGDWLLVHVNIAIRAIDALEAAQISDALLAVTRAAAGESFEYLLADLIDREPQLPAHLRPRVRAAQDNDHTVARHEVPHDGQPVT